jgi:hypothetical protein
MKLMVDGTWRGEVPPTPELGAQPMIHAGRFRDRINSDGSSEFPQKRAAITSTSPRLARSRTVSWSCGH